jgi:D-lactate dehydrogenase (cytochrome)
MSSPDSELAALLVGIVGTAHVVTDAAERRYLSRDFFYWNDAGTAALAVAPADAAQVQAVMRLLAAQGREVVIRGGGMSTGRSYVPNTDHAVLLDMRRLDRIREINVTDRYLVAEAGCTWQAVMDALAPHGLRPDFTIPLSGSVSTVGGAMAHHVTGGMKGILGIEVVRANGDLVRTGSWARRDFPEPYYRDYGPDITGLFLGDTGAFGIKTAVALHLSRPPEASAYASFSFATMADQTAVMVELAALDYLTMRSGFDPYLTRIAMDVNLNDGIKTLGAVVKAGSSRLGGLRQALSIAAAGQRALKDAGWTLHIRADQLTQQAATEGIARARAICTRSGEEIAPSMAIAMGAGRLTVRGALSRDGDRWIATNSIFPLSRAAAACAALQTFLAERQTEFAAHGVKTGCFTTCSGLHFQAEPLFWWPDAVSELALRHIDPAEAKRFREIPENPETRAFVTRTRHELRDLFQAQGAIHVHTSKFFRFGTLLLPGTRDLLRELKTVLDPQLMLNQGNLGLSDEPA